MLLVLPVYPPVSHAGKGNGRRLRARLFVTAATQGRSLLLLAQLPFQHVSCVQRDLTPVLARLHVRFAMPVLTQAHPDRQTVSPAILGRGHRRLRQHRREFVSHVLQELILCLQAPCHQLPVSPVGLEHGRLRWYPRP